MAKISDLSQKIGDEHRVNKGNRFTNLNCLYRNLQTKLLLRTKYFYDNFLISFDITLY